MAGTEVPAYAVQGLSNEEKDTFVERRVAVATKKAGGSARRRFVEKDDPQFPGVLTGSGGRVG